MHFIVLIVAFAGFASCAPVNWNVDRARSSLLDVNDEELDEEYRKRHLGGPWSPEEAMSMLNLATDLLSTSPNRVSRMRRFELEAKQLLQLITGIENPKINASFDSLDKDADYMDEQVVLESGHTVTLETMQKIIDMHDGSNGERRRSLDGIQKLYNWFRPTVHVARFRARLQSGGGTRFSKLKEVDAYAAKIFKESRDKRGPVHGRMIQRWALQRAAQINLDDFQASESWLTRFKRRHGIVSRKVTIYTSRSEQEKTTQIAESIGNFTQDYARETRFFDHAHIWNFDQTGFNYEPSNLRTLSFKGERDTCLLLDSHNKHTHSYTLQPMILRSGHLFPKVLLVMQDGEEFSPGIARRMRELETSYGNVEIYSSKSGKLTSSLIDRWFTGTLKDGVEAIQLHKMTDSHDESAVVILADSWSGHSKPSQQQDLLYMGAKMLKIPPLTTDKIQPLDVNFNRQLKIFYNRIIEEAFYQDIIKNVTARDGIVNIHSLIHNQFMSSKYRDMIKYAWHNTDPAFNISELTNYPPKMVNSINFGFDGASKCEARGCNNHAFVKCSHCDKLLCLQHFLERVCFHNPHGSPRH